MVDSFIYTISKHTENLGRKRLLESVSPPTKTNKKEKVGEAEDAAHVGSEEGDRSKDPQPDGQNNPIPVLGTSSSRYFWPGSVTWEDDNG